MKKKPSSKRMYKIVLATIAIITIFSMIALAIRF